MKRLLLLGLLTSCVDDPAVELLPPPLVAADPPLPERLIQWSVVNGASPAECPDGSVVSISALSPGQGSPSYVIAFDPPSDCRDGSRVVSVDSSFTISVHLFDQTGGFEGRGVATGSNDTFAIDAYHASAAVSWQLHASDGAPATCGDLPSVDVMLTLTSTTSGERFDTTFACTDAVFAVSSEVPDGHYAAQLSVLDAGGSVIGQSNPAEHMVDRRFAELGSFDITLL